ncbi:MAG: hypothetical protein ACTHK3_08530 [Solirubrobacterales bacterium]
MVEQRSAETRARAETALARLLHGLDGADIEIVVLGGLVPEVLTRDRDVEAPAHLGTTDVDILLVTHVEHDADLSAVERSLVGLDFAPEGDGWRWRGTVDGRKVKIEFLCDLETVRDREIVKPRGCRALTACNLRGTGFVTKDWAWEEIRSTDSMGNPIVVQVRFAGLQGYLISKCFAVRDRAAEKDYYDLPYVLLHNREGGPVAAGELILAGPMRGELTGLAPLFREVRARYANPNDLGPRSYASQMLLVESGQDETLLRGDAAVAVGAFFEILLADREPGAAF